MMRFCFAPTSSSPSKMKTGFLTFVDDEQVGDAALVGDFGDFGPVDR